MLIYDSRALWMERVFLSAFRQCREKNCGRQSWLIRIWSLKFFKLNPGTFTTKIGQGFSGDLFPSLLASTFIIIRRTTKFAVNHKAMKKSSFKIHKSGSNVNRKWILFISHTSSTTCVFSQFCFIAHQVFIRLAKLIISLLTPFSPTLHQKHFECVYLKIIFFWYDFRVDDVVFFNPFTMAFVEVIIFCVVTKCGKNYTTNSTEYELTPCKVRSIEWWYH